MSKVSVIMSAYNAGAWIANALNHLAAQTHPDVEVIVIDSGSTDDTPDIIALSDREWACQGCGEIIDRDLNAAKNILTFGKERTAGTAEINARGDLGTSPSRGTAKLFPLGNGSSHKVTCLRTSREPLYTAWNRGLRLATGDYILQNAADDWLEKDCICLMAEALDKHPEAVLAYTDMVVHHEDGRTDNIIRPEYDQYMFRQTCLVGPCPMYRKQAVLDIGGFDETMTVSADWKMWCAISGKGSFIHSDSEISPALFTSESGRRILKSRQTTCGRFGD